MFVRYNRPGFLVGLPHPDLDTAPLLRGMPHLVAIELRHAISSMSSGPFASPRSRGHPAPFSATVTRMSAPSKVGNLRAPAIVREGVLKGVRVRLRNVDQSLFHSCRRFERANLLRTRSTNLIWAGGEICRLYVGRTHASRRLSRISQIKPLASREPSTHARLEKRGDSPPVVNLDATIGLEHAERPSQYLAI
ncbi:UNVERIFIED_ORG: hypothetical protein GGD51_000791 [Rhizobium esperanzae]